MIEKQELRDQLRRTRRDHAAATPDNMRALLFKRPPAPLMALIPVDAIIGLYHAARDEAPCVGYAKFFYDEGHTIALPRMSQGASMQFARHSDPYDESDLEKGPLGILQPKPDAEAIAPEIVFVPLLGFTADGARLGQGGGHYDRWLAANSGTTAIGMGWDCQMVDELPTEPHDVALDAVVTPTRLYGPF